jgi:hypothetical protein
MFLSRSFARCANTRCPTPLTQREKRNHLPPCGGGRRAQRGGRGDGAEGACSAVATPLPNPSLTRGEGLEVTPMAGANGTPARVPRDQMRLPRDQ